MDADRNMLDARRRDWGTGVVVHAKEQRILSKGIYKNSVEHKYSYNAVQYKIPAYGWSSTKDHIGVWFINPTIEYLSGGAVQAGTGLPLRRQRQPRPDHPRLLARQPLRRRRAVQHRRRARSGTRSSARSSSTVNSLDKPTPTTPADLDTLAATAGNPTVPPPGTTTPTRLVAGRARPGEEGKRQVALRLGQRRGLSAQERARHRDRPARARTIRRRPPTEDCPHLTVGLPHPDLPPAAPVMRPPASGNGNAVDDWDARRASTTSSGTTAPRTARSPSPTSAPAPTRCTPLPTACSANSPRPTSPSRPARRSTWASSTGSRCATASRSGRSATPTAPADKFYKGDGANYWLWGWACATPLLFPNDITYTIGKSDYHKDWFFEQVPHGDQPGVGQPRGEGPRQPALRLGEGGVAGPLPADRHSRPVGIYGRGRATTWTIKFNMTKPAQGQAALRVALAGADGTRRAGRRRSTARASAASATAQSGQCPHDHHQRPALQHQQGRLAANTP